MRRTLIPIVALPALFTASAFAQPALLIDHFDGPVLHPQWVFPLGTPDYHFDNSVMVITGMDPPRLLMSDNGFASQENFRVDIRMGFEAGATELGIGLYVMGGGHPRAHFSYSHDPLSGSSISATGWHAFPNSQTVSMPAPSSGVFDFAMERNGGLVDFYFDGTLFARLPGGGLVSSIMFAFNGYPSEIAPLYLDYVQVVPAPGSAFALMCGLGLLFAPRRRR